MTRTVHLTIPGTPIPKGRPRFTRTGHTYTDSKTRDYETRVLAEWIKAAGMRVQPHDGPVHVHLIATFEPPTSWPKAKRAQALRGHLDHLARPDLDNVTKAALDALNGYAWRDDSQINTVHATKTYGPVAQLVIVLHLHHHTEETDHA